MPTLCTLDLKFHETKKNGLVHTHTHRMVSCTHIHSCPHIHARQDKAKHTHNAQTRLQPSDPVMFGGGGGGGGGGLIEPVVLFDSGTVNPSLAYWIYVRGTKSGMLFPRKTFEKSVKVSAFLRLLASTVAPVRCLLHHVMCTCALSGTVSA
jgi:hypothetical protein